MLQCGWQYTSNWPKGQSRTGWWRCGWGPPVSNRQLWGSKYQGLLQTGWWTNTGRWPDRHPWCAAIQWPCKKGTDCNDCQPCQMAYGQLLPPGSSAPDESCPSCCPFGQPGVQGDCRNSSLRWVSRHFTEICVSAFVGVSVIHQSSVSPPQRVQVHEPCATFQWYTRLYAIKQCAFVGVCVFHQKMGSNHPNWYKFMDPVAPFGNLGAHAKQSNVKHLWVCMCNGMMGTLLGQNLKIWFVGSWDC